MAKLDPDVAISVGLVVDPDRYVSISILQLNLLAALTDEVQPSGDAAILHRIDQSSKLAKPLIVLKIKRDSALRNPHRDSSIGCGDHVDQVEPLGLEDEVEELILVEDFIRNVAVVAGEAGGATLAVKRRFVIFGVIAFMSDARGFSDCYLVLRSIF